MLLQIPDLVLRKVVTYLTLKDVQNLRLVNKYLCLNVYPIIRIEFPQYTLIQPRHIFDCWQYQEMTNVRIRNTLFAELQFLKVKFLRKLRHLELYEGEDQTDPLFLSEIPCPELVFFKAYIYVPMESMRMRNDIMELFHESRFTLQHLSLHLQIKPQKDMDEDDYIVIHTTNFDKLKHVELFVIGNNTQLCVMDYAQTIDHVVIAQQCDDEHNFSIVCPKLRTLHHYCIDDFKEHLNMNKCNKVVYNHFINHRNHYYEESDTDSEVTTDDEYENMDLTKSENTKQSNVNLRSLMISELLRSDYDDSVPKETVKNKFEITYSYDNKHKNRSRKIFYCNYTDVENRLTGYDNGTYFLKDYHTFKYRYHKKVAHVKRLNRRKINFKTFLTYNWL
uniref:F-box domain-containing protein n=1 Tax=Nesodiprion zhejiangensis nucleopolyhedrovirus TaxID=3135970 RepID=A0AAN0LJ95_9BACU